MSAPEDRERLVTVWSRWPEGRWVVERSYPLRYVEDVISVTSEARRNRQGREVRWFEHGTDPNEPPGRLVWSPEQVQVTPPCQACRRRPADDPEIRELCGECAERIDRDYEWLRDLGELEAGP